MPTRKTVVFEDAMGCLIRETFYSDDSDDPAAPLRELARREAERDDPREGLTQTRAWALGILEAEGWHLSAYASPVNLISAVEKNAEPLSRAFFAAKVLWSVIQIEQAARADEMTDLCWAAVQLGTYMSELESRQAVLRRATTGKKMADNGLENARRSAKPDLRLARFKRMRELIPVHGVDKAAAEVSMAGLGTVAAIKKQWNSYVKQELEPRLRRKKGTRC